MIALGIDTHKHTHVAVALDHLGQVLGELTIDAGCAGYDQLIIWSKGLGNDDLRVGIEGTGSWGAGLCAHLQAAGLSVFEVERPSRKDRARGKSDRIDALAAARSVLTGTGLASPRSPGLRQALAALLVAYNSQVKERTRLRNQLQALCVTAPTHLRERIGQGQGQALERRLRRMRQAPDARPEEEAIFMVLREMAKRSLELAKGARAHERKITEIVGLLDRTLLDEYGVGPICAAKLLVADPKRFKSEQAFARCNGTAPLEASSGKTVRHRLSRRGDRQVNNAIHTIALIRSVHHEESRAYLERKMCEGKTRKEAMRCLKRQISRRLYKRICEGGLTL